MTSAERARAVALIESFLGSFYVTVTRGLYVPMLAYSGYDVEEISAVTVAAALLGVLASYACYRRSNEFSSRIEAALPIVHGLERLLWLCLPLAARDAFLLSLCYSAALAITIPVGALLNVALFSSLGPEAFTRISAERAAVGSAASILGGLYAVEGSMLIGRGQTFFDLYLSSCLVGLLGTLSLLFLPLGALPEGSPVPSRLARGEAEEARVNVFVMLSLMMAGGNLLGLAWPPLLRDIGAPLYGAAALSLFGSLGGVVGSLALRGSRSYLLGVILNTTLTGVVALVRAWQIHVTLSFGLSATFVGANLLAASVYSRYVHAIGVGRASVLLSAANAIGMLAAALAGLALGSDYPALLALSASLKALAALVASLGIPGASLVEPETAREYARLLSSASLLGYNLAMGVTRAVARLLVESLALAALVALVLLIYEVASILAG
ncbi:MAG: hypothetical protein QXU97_04185 [Fervidicoccaceae archaeon]